MNKKSYLLLICALFVGLFFSCDVNVGLGEQVDALSPTMSVENPPIDAVIRGEFALSGKWSDDGEIKSISIVLERTDGLGKAINLDGTIVESEESKNGTWSVVINPIENKYVDGSYQATITAEDGGKHKTSVTRTFKIDNTAPLIVLERPSAKTTDIAADSYGQKFTLVGQAADTNNINLIKVKIYDDIECTHEVHTVSLKNVPSTINLDVAKFVENVDNDYSAIYGYNTKNGEKPLYCKIIAYDEAKRYPVEGNQSEEDLLGNVAYTYYLYEEIATSVLSNYKLPEVYKMYSGEYFLTEERAVTSLEDIEALLNGKNVDKGFFSLNPANNPTFTVAGRNSLNLDGNDFSSEANELSNGNSLIIEVSTGLDSIPIEGSSMKVYVQLCNPNGETTGDKIYIEDVQKTKSGSSYRLVAKIQKTNDISIGKNYIVGVEGTDESKNEIVATGKGYGFHLTGIPPVISVTKDKDIITTSKSEAHLSDLEGFAPKQSFTNTIEIESGDGPFTLERIEGESVTKIADFEDTSYTDIFTPAAFNTSNIVTYRVTDVNDVSVEKQLKYKVDNTAPVISNLLVPGISDTERFTFKADVSDKVPEPNSANESSSTVARLQYKFGENGIIFTNTSTSFAQDIYFSDVFDSEGVKTIYIRAIDEVGNMSDWESASFSYDRAAPELILENKPNGLPNGTYKLKGYITETCGMPQNAEGNYELSVEEWFGETKTDHTIILTKTDSKYSFEAGLPFDSTLSGNIKYVFAAKDISNKALIGTTTFSATRDIVPAVITVTTPGSATFGENAISSDSAVFRGTITEDNPNKILYQCIKEGGTAPAALTTEDMSTKTDAQLEALKWTVVDISTISIDGSGKGSWNFTTNFNNDPKIRDGKYKLYIQAADLSGNICDMQIIDFAVDAAAPELKVNVLAEDGTSVTETLSGSSTIKVTNGTKFKLGGTVTDASGIKSFTINGSEVTVDGDGKWSTEDFTTEGTHEFKIIALDNSGNADDSIKGKLTESNTAVVFDLSNPVVEITTISEDDAWIYATGKTYISGIATDNSGINSIKVKLGEDPNVEPTTIAVSSPWTYTLDCTNLTENTDAADSRYVLTVVVTDKCEKETTITRYFKLDKTTPSISDLAVSDSTTKSEYTNNVTNVTVSGYAFDGVKNLYRSLSKVEVSAKDASGNAVDINNDEDKTTVTLIPSSTKDATFGFFSGAIATKDISADGTYIFSVTATDYAGNQTTKEINVVVDKTNPQFTSVDLDWSTNITIPHGINRAGIKVKAADTNLDSVYYFVNDGSDSSKTTASLTDTEWVSLNKDSGDFVGNISFNDGAGNVWLKVVDKAGNKNYQTTTTYDVDTTAPDICTVLTVDGSAYTGGTKLSNGEKDITFTVNASDYNNTYKTENNVTAKIGNQVTRIASVSLSKLGNRNETTAGTATLDSSIKTGEWTIVIPKEEIKELADGTHNVKVNVTDDAGNTKEFDLFNIKMDKTAPVPEFTNIFDADSEKAGYQVNGTISLGGVVTETNAITEVKLEYSTDGTNWTEASHTNTNVGTYNWKYEEINTTALTDNTTYKFRVSATDEAGNTGYTVQDIEINQNTDRSVIKFNEISGVTGTMRKYTNTISGSITDDDEVSEFKVFATTSSTTLPDWDNYDSDAQSANGTLDWSAGGSSFTYEPKTSSDGRVYIYFYVKDSQGGVFKTAAASTLNQPYVDYKGDKDVEGKDIGKLDNSTVITYQTDSNPPVFNGKWYFAGTSTEVTATTAGAINNELPGVLTIGGTKKPVIKFRVLPYDASGIKSVSGSLSTSTPTAVTFTKEEDPSEYYVGTLDVSSITTGSYSFVTTVEDNSDLTSSSTFTLNVDNAGPTVNITSPDSSTLVTGDITISGYTSDTYSTVSLVKYVVANDTNKNNTDASFYDLLKNDNTEFNARTNNAFEFPLDGIKYNEDGSEFAGNGTNYFQNAALPATLAALTNYSTFTTDSQIYDIPVYFVIADELGNYSVNRDYKLHYNPYSDRPTTEILYPDPNATENVLSGTIRLSGSAIDNVSVSKVYYQIRPKNMTWADAKTWASGTLGATVVDSSNITAIKADANLDADSSFWGIEASGTASWYKSLNDSNSLQITSTVLDQAAGTYQVEVRVVAVDNNYTLGNWSKPVKITINPAAPSIGSSVPTTVNKFNGAILVDSKNATGTIYLKGEWYLITSVEHSNGISEISYQLGDGTTEESAVYIVQGSTIKESDMIYDNKSVTAYASGKKGYTVKIPLNTASGEGIRTVKISTKDATESHLSSSASFSFYYDNVAPTISDVKYNSANSFVAGSSLTNSNNQLTFGSTVEDSIAGYGKVLFYFYREKTNGNGAERRIYDPFIGNWQGAAAANPARVDVTDASGNLKSGITKETLGAGETTAPLYGVTLAVSKTDSSTLTFTGDNSHIRTGGIAKIADSYRVIKSKDVSGSTVTLTFSPACETAFTEAFFPYAQVVDNQNGEKTKSFTSTTVNIQGDDGDGMPESVSGLSTSKIWEAGIHGDWIPDGPITFVMFAFDNSENVAVFTQTGTMANNRPRISKLHLGTDLNGNGSFTDAEFETYNLLGVEGASQEVFDLTTKDYSKYQNNTTVAAARKSFTIKDKLAVIPEFVGGNGDIFMVFNNNDTTTSPNASGDVVDSRQTGSGAALRSSETYTGTSISGNLFTVSKTDVGSDTASKQMSFTFWDSTDEAVAGQTTQYAFIRVKDFVIDQVDDTSPKVRVNPFYWESAAKNSLGGNSSANGHIELEADWTAKDESGNYITAYDGNSSGTYLDSDPKVSGQIVFSGTAYDEHKLSTLSFSYGSLTDVTAATYNGTSWTANSGTAWSCTIYDESTTSTNMQTAAHFDTDSAYFDQNGHKIFWKITIDTAAAITNVADKDQTFTVTASDGTSTWDATEVTDMTGKTDSYAIDAAYNKPAYRTDVVPYITKINTTLGKLKSGNPSVYSRTALGHYAVYTHKNSKTYTTTQTTVTYDEDYETVTIEGFNLYNASIKPKYGSTQLSMDTENTSAVSFPVNLLSTSGEVDLTVSDIPTLNNKNNNNAQGSAGQTLSTSNYATYAYNRVPNGDTNNNLTDDVYFSVWQFNSKAALPISGRVQYPQMKINPSSNMLNFAFADGPLYFDMGSSTVSYKYWTASYDMMSGVGFGVDNNGNTYATVTGGDTNSKQADKAVFLTSLWGVSLNGTGDSRHDSTYNGTVGNRYSSIGQKFASGETDIDFDRYRIKSPSIATVQNGVSKNIYMAYYDNLNDEVRFKFGSLAEKVTGTVKSVSSVSGATLNTSSNTNNSNKEIYLLDSNKMIIGTATLGTMGGSTGNRTYTMSNVVYNSGCTESAVKNYCLTTETKLYSKVNFGNFYDIEDAKAPNDYDENADYDYVISDGSRTGYLPGAYVSLGVVPGAAKNGDETVVLIWYDAVNNQMLYTYNTTPTTNLAADGYKNTALKYSTDAGWSVPEVIFTSAGSYCNLAVDANGGIHMAAFDSATGDLKYAYKSSYGGSTSTCTVDSSGIVGTDITIDVALNSSNQAIPYIGYYALSASRPKYAYLVSDYAGTAPDGIDSNESFTGKWEVTYLPLSNITTQGTVNVGVWKDSDGKLKDSETGNSYVIKTGSSYDATNAGNAYGNGTPNAILAYEHTVTGSTSTIETAQLK